MKEYMPDVWNAWEAKMNQETVHWKIHKLRLWRLLIVFGLAEPLAYLRGVGWAARNLFGPFFWVTEEPTR